MENNETIRERVRRDYGVIASAGKGDKNGDEKESCGCGCGNTGLDAGAISKLVGYSDQDLEAVPEGANLGLGCGSPAALAGIKAGETVVDLGSGAGFDCFLAAEKVGPEGRVIGVDMTPEMISRARRNKEKTGADNVNFRLGEIEHLPVGDNTSDLIISNCVINLSPEKASVFSEAFRVLRPGGRIAISDILALKPLPEKLAEDLAMISSCIGGAATVADTEALLASAGFSDIRITTRPVSAELADTLVPGCGAEAYVAPADITAVKAE
ncbi:MAG: arsenite methyltransferase [Desulfobacterales bacterium]|nr:arsenite methyltransferase [Desulfobacterales bacterium]